MEFVMDPVPLQYDDGQPLEVGPMPMQEKMRRYRAIFDSMDVDRSGVLDPDELCHAVVALGLTPGRVNDIFGVAVDQRLNFDQFVTAMEEYEHKLAEELEQEEATGSDDWGSDEFSLGDLETTLDAVTAKLLRKLFDQLDVNRSDSLTTEDIHNHIRNLSLREASISSEELNFFFALVEEADASPDSSVDIHIFANVASQHPDFLERMRGKTLASRYCSHGNESSRASPMPRMLGGLSLKAKTNPEFKLYRQVFDEFDKDGDGVVSDKDVTAMMNSLGRVPTAEESEFMFEMLQLVGEHGFTFDDFVELMTEESSAVTKLGRSVSTWKMRQSNPRLMTSVNKVKASISRGMGLTRAIQMEGSGINENEHATLQRINSRIQQSFLRNSAHEKSAHENTSGAFNFMPAPNMPGGGIMSNMFPTQGSQQALAGNLLTPLELLRYQAVFNALDMDKDGRVSFQEMTMSLKSVTGRQPTEDEIQEFLLEADADSNGTMEFEEFVLIMQQTKRALSRSTDPPVNFCAAASTRKLEKYRVVFDSFDSDGKGQITSKGLATALGKLGKKIDGDKVHQIFTQYDLNRNGALEFEEFVPLMDSLVAKELSL